MKVRFTKMHGAGNDYIYVDASAYKLPDPSRIAIKWSDRHTGIGSDGLVLIDQSPVPEADFSMRIFNADGSEAMMCGNASRCIGKYLYEKGLTNKTEIRLLTLSGVKTLSLHLSSDAKTVESVTVDMLAPVLSEKTQLTTDDGSMTEGEVRVLDATFRGTFVSMGNPHFVIFVDDIEKFDISKYGPLLEHYLLFPQRCNIEFVQPLTDGSLRTRVWERGSGVTMACGTGACATAVAASLTGRSSRRSTIVMDGGTLYIEWSPSDGHVYMTGPAAFCFEGEASID